MGPVSELLRNCQRNAGQRQQAIDRDRVEHQLGTSSRLSVGTMVVAVPCSMFEILPRFAKICGGREKVYVLQIAAGHYTPFEL